MGLPVLKACDAGRSSIDTDASLTPGCEPICPGCAHRRLSRADSEGQKAEFLGRCLAAWRQRLAVLEGPPDAQRWAYRERVCLSTQWRDGRWAIGLRRRLEVVDIPHCPVHTPRVRGTLALLVPRLPGPQRFPLHYYLQSGGQVTLVVKSRERPALDWVDEIREHELAAAGVEGLWLHLNPSTGRRVLAKREWLQLWGAPRSLDPQGLRYGPTAFRQVAGRLAERALDRAEAFLEPEPGDLLIDLYCGLGAGLRRWSKRGAVVLGVELAGEAAELAAINAPAAGVLRGSCTQRLPQLEEALSRGVPGRCLLYLNPPRTGVEPAVLHWVTGRMRPQRIAYLSCSAGTLGRDLRSLEAAGYEVVELRPFDFFPQTHHVEVLALLTRRD